MTARATFRQHDLKRALKAAKDAGVQVIAEIRPDGTIRIEPAPPPEAQKPMNPVEARRARRGEA